MAINLTDSLNAATTKGKLGDAKQVYLNGDTKNLQQAYEETSAHFGTLDNRSTQMEKAIQDISVTGGASTANAVSYNNSTSKLEAVTAQGAIDEVSSIGHFAKRGGIVNISTNYNSTNTAEVLTLKQAIAKVPSEDRVLGFQGKFLTENGWVTYQFNGNSVSDWSNKEYWSLLSDSTNIAQELGTSKDVAISQKATTDAIRRYSGGFPVKSADSIVEEFANGILSCKIVPKFSLDVEGLSDFKLSNYNKSSSSYSLSGGLHLSGEWYKTIQFTGSISSLIENKYILFRNNPNDDWGQCYILADVTNFPTKEPGTYPTITFYTEDIVSPYHPYLDFAIRTLIDRPDIDSFLEQMVELNEYLGRKFVSYTSSIIKPFTDTIIEVYVLAKFDTSDTDGLFRFDNWSSQHNISGGIYKNGWVHTVSINKTDVEIGGLTLWYGENEYFQVALLGDDSKWVTPELGTYPSFRVKLDKVSKPVHPTIWSAINKMNTSILDARISALNELYLPKSNTAQKAEDNSNYGSYYDNSHWKTLEDNGCRVLYAVTRSDITFDKIYTTLCQPSSTISNKKCKLRVYVLDRQVTTSDLRGEEGFIFEKSINPYTDLPTKSDKTFYTIELPNIVTVGANKTISVVLFDPDDTLESGIAIISSWVYKGDEEHHDSLQLIYRCYNYNYNTQSFNFIYFTYADMVTYNSYIGNIEPIFVLTGESGDTLRRDINSNSQKIAELKESGDTSKFTSRSILPATLHAAVGLEFNLYYDGFNLLPDYGKGEPSWMFNIQSEIESQWKALNYRSYQRTMQSSDIGKHTLTIDYYNNKNQKFSTESPDERFTVGLEVVNNVNPSTQKRILIIGDSTNENGNVANRIYKNFHEEATGGIAPIMLGTRSDSTKTWRHEARTEKTYSMFANGETVIRVDFKVPEGFTEDDIATANPSPYYNIGGTNVYLRHLWHLNGDGTGYAIGYNNSSVSTSWTGTATKTSGAASMPSNIEVTRVQRLSRWSPFKNNEGVGTLDFGYYRTVILGLGENEKIDLMLSDLGINDIYTGYKTQTDINNIVNNAKKLIDAYLADGNGKFAICYPKGRSSAIADSDRRYYPMRMDMQSLREALVKTFDNGAYNENVLICGSGMQIDRWYGYPLVAANVASRIPIQETKPIEGVHPSDYGYQQIGDAMTATIWAVLQ